MATRIVPVGDRLLIEIEDITNRKSGSIIIPDTTGERLRVGKVIGVGNEVGGKYIIGDRVVYSVMSGTNIHMPKYGIVDDNKYRLLLTDEVLARIEEEEG